MSCIGHLFTILILKLKRKIHLRILGKIFFAYSLLWNSKMVESIVLLMTNWPYINWERRWRVSSIMCSSRETLHPSNPIVHEHLCWALDRRIGLDIVRALYFVRPYRRIVPRKFCRNNVERPAVVANDLLTCHRLDSRRTCNGSVYRARKLVSLCARDEGRRERRARRYATRVYFYLRINCKKERDVRGADQLDFGIVDGRE